MTEEAKMDDVTDVIKAISLLCNSENIEEFVVNENGLKLLSYSVLCKEEHPLANLLETLELALGSIVTDEYGMIDKTCETSLNKSNIKISKLRYKSDDEDNNTNDLTYTLECDKFSVVFRI